MYDTDDVNNWVINADKLLEAIKQVNDAKNGAWQYHEHKKLAGEDAGAAAAMLNRTNELLFLLYKNAKRHNQAWIKINDLSVEEGDGELSSEQQANYKLNQTILNTKTTNLSDNGVGSWLITVYDLISAALDTEKDEAYQKLLEEKILASIIDVAELFGCEFVLIQTGNTQSTNLVKKGTNIPIVKPPKA